MAETLEEVSIKRIDLEYLKQTNSLVRLVNFEKLRSGFIHPNYRNVCITSNLPMVQRYRSLWTTSKDSKSPRGPMISVSLRVRNSVSLRKLI